MLAGRSLRAIVFVCPFILILSTPGSGRCQISFSQSGYNLEASSTLQTDWALSTSGIPSPFNQNTLASADNSWNMMAYRAESRVTLGLDDSRARELGLDGAAIFVRPRFFSDLGPQVDGSLKDVNLFGGLGGGRYPGNGWMAQSVGTHEYVVDAMEAYADISRGGWSLRIGKQRLNWSPMMFARILDNADSFDLRRHGMFNDLTNEYDEERIGEWTAKLRYALPKEAGSFAGTSAEAFISPDFEPWIFPAQGSAYSLFPSEALVNDSAQIARARHKLVYGGAVKSTIAGVEVSLNYVSTPENLGVLQFASATGPGAVAGTPFVIDPLHGMSFTQFTLFQRELRTNAGAVLPADWPLPPDLSSNFFARGPFDWAVTRIFPREDILGGSVGYHLKPEQFAGASLLQGFFHIEASYTPRKKFSFQLKRRPERVGELAIGLMYQRDFYVLSTESPGTFLVEYWYKSRSDFFDRFAPANHERDFPMSVFSLQQPLFDSKLRVNNTVLLDASRGGGLWYQPGVKWFAGHGWEYGGFWNFFSGGDRDMFGWLSASDEVVLQAIYRY